MFAILKSTLIIPYEMFNCLNRLDLNFLEFTRNLQAVIFIEKFIRVIVMKIKC